MSDVGDAYTCPQAMGGTVRVAGLARDRRRPAVCSSGRSLVVAEDAWLAISARAERDRGTLATAIGDHELASDPGYATLSLRQQAEDEIEKVF